MSQTYLEDLLLRMDSKERLPQSGPMISSKDSVAWVAHREAEHLDDLGLIPELNTLIAKAKCVRELQKLAIVTGHLNRNTDGQAHETYDLLLQHTPDSDTAWHYVFDCARKSGIESARPYALKVIAEPFKGDLAFASAIQYLGVMGSSEDVKLLGDLLDSNCKGNCHPMYSVVALQNLGHRSAIPYLRRAIDARVKSRKSEDLETAGYARFAIEHILECPPPEFSNARVESWAIIPNSADRLAIVLHKEVYALLTCNDKWQPENSELVADRKEAVKLARERYANLVEWHQSSKFNS